MNNSAKHQDQDGFTLIELMITLVIAAILVGIAVPSFQGFIKRNTADTLQSRVASAMSTARTEAASRNTFVSICASDNGDDCGGSWSNGWLVFENPDSDTTHDAGEVIIDRYNHLGGSVFDFAQGQDTTNKLSQLTFNQQGFLVNESSALVTICNSEKESAYTRGLFVNASGLVVKTKDNDGDGVEDYLKSGTATALNCS